MITHFFNFYFNRSASSMSPFAFKYHVIHMLLFHIIFYKVVKSLWVDIYVIKYEGRDDKAVEHLFADQHVKGSFRN